MIEKMKAFCKNHREIIDYMLVGCGTTVAAWGSKYLCNLLFFDGTAFPLPPVVRGQRGLCPGGRDPRRRSD